mmetsp:Transcript_40077/g.89820  ORF Transcript_40077/g.89820 Transcript_40077/m.89820 type:complete len:380 (+) Transcript_40077:36-1175(+)
MGATQSAEEMNDNNDTSSKLNNHQGANDTPMEANLSKTAEANNHCPKPSMRGDFRSMPAAAWDQIHSRFEASHGKAAKEGTSLRASAPEWTPWTALGHETGAYHPPLDAQWSVPLPREVSTGGQSGGGQCHTPEAGSRRPSYTPYGPYGPPPVPGVPYTGDPVMQRAMMEKAFYDGWADAAAAAARAAVASGQIPPPAVPPSPASTAGGQASVPTPVIGGVAASLAAHVQAMPPSPAMQAAAPLQPQPPSPATQVPGMQPISPALSGSQLQMPNTPSQASTGEHTSLDQLQYQQRIDLQPVQVAATVPAHPTAIPGSESPRSSILKLCGAWGALAKQNIPKLAMGPGHALQRAMLLHFRNRLGATPAPKEVATLTCARV